MVPGCGSRLITAKINPKPLITDLKLSETKIPNYTNHSQPVSIYDQFYNMNIFTEFGDLTPSQMLTLFNAFISWPEYKECPFLSSLENALLKLETSMDSSANDVIELHDDTENAGKTSVNESKDKKNVI